MGVIETGMLGRLGHPVTRFDKLSGGGAPAFDEGPGGTRDLFPEQG